MCARAGALLSRSRPGNWTGFPLHAVCECVEEGVGHEGLVDLREKEGEMERDFLSGGEEWDGSVMRY